MIKCFSVVDLSASIAFHRSGAFTSHGAHRHGDVRSQQIRTCQGAVIGHPSLLLTIASCMAILRHDCKFDQRLVLASFVHWENSRIRDSSPRATKNGELLFERARLPAAPAASKREGEKNQYASICTNVYVHGMLWVWDTVNTYVRAKCT